MCTNTVKQKYLKQAIWMVFLMLNIKGALCIHVSMKAFLRLRLDKFDRHNILLHLIIYNKLQRENFRAWFEFPVLCLLVGFITYNLICSWISDSYRLPWGLSVKEFACQCRRHKFQPWVGNIQWRRKWPPNPVFFLENLMDRKTWWALVHGVAKEPDKSKIRATI